MSQDWVFDNGVFKLTGDTHQVQFCQSADKTWKCCVSEIGLAGVSMVKDCSLKDMFTYGEELLKNLES